jgi:release factor glutamine methyltransferase
MLMGHMLKCQRHDLYLIKDWELDSKQVAHYYALIETRCAGVPIQYITNRQEFMGLEFYVDEGVLIPRGDTEVLVEHIIEYTTGLEEPPRILELGTGSGAIAISLAILIPDASIIAVDIQPHALKVAEKNAKSHGVSNRVDLLLGDLFSPLLDCYEKESFHVVVSNPPYIPSGDIESLEPQVKNYEPRAALDGGKNGLEFYGRLAEEGLSWLHEGGLWAVEIGYGQCEDVKTILKGTGGYCDIRVIKDLAGINRVVSAIRIPKLSHF